MAKKRINLSIDPKLHAWAQDHAEKHGTNFSAYVAELLERERTGQEGDVTLTREARAALRREVAEDVLKVVLGRRRAG